MIHLHEATNCGFNLTRFLSKGKIDSTRNKNILHITTYLQGGAGRTITELVKSQDKAGAIIRFVCAETEYPGYCNYPEYMNALSNSSADTLKVDSTFKRDAHSRKRAIEAIRSILSNSKIDLVHCHAPNASSIALEVLAELSVEVPLIQTMHGWGNNKTPEQERTDLKSVSQVDRLIVVSRSSADLLIAKGVPENRLRFIPNGVKLQGVPSSMDEPEAIASPETKRILCLGTLCRRKNQGLLIEALSEIDRAKIPFQCVFIGEGEDREFLEELTDKLGLRNCIQFMGYIQNAAALVPTFDLLVSPSLSEGMPLAVLEAFGSRVPTIASDTPEHKELIEDGSTGFLFVSDNRASLVESLQRFFASNPDALDSMVDSSEAIFRENYAFENIIKAYDRLYRELLVKP
ncbi:MAG: hypothetical protein CBD18_05375 [Opitutales bacterium TMED158]|nr:MAG: hypothetical protein CBD18_05375 [Opitutales bacterium TMED158]